MILLTLLLLPLLLYITRFPNLKPDADTIVWLLWRLPHTPAVWIAKRYTRAAPHDAADGVCLPCHAANRIKRAQHDATVGPLRTVYCSKCGLDSWKWSRYCANKVVQVNNRAARTPRAWYKPVFW